MPHTSSMTTSKKSLPAGYTLRRMDAEEFFPLFDQHYDRIFGQDHVFFAHDYYSEAEKAKAKILSGKMGEVFKLHLGIFSPENELVAFSFGFQETEDSFYVMCSAVVEDKRNLGLYSILLDSIIDICSEQGFQVIYGTHCATNNAVIVPKLKKGFVISKMECSDIFGVVLHVSYFTNPLRRKVMDYRSGHRKPDDELKKIFKF